MFDLTGRTSFSSKLQEIKIKIDALLYYRQFGRGDNTGISFSLRDEIQNDLNFMTIADLSRDSDIKYIVNFLSRSALIEIYHYTPDEIRTSLHSLYNQIIQIKDEEISSASLTSLRHRLEKAKALESVLNRISLSSGNRIKNAALEVLTYLELFNFSS